MHVTHDGSLDLPHPFAGHDPLKLLLKDPRGLQGFADEAIEARRPRPLQDRLDLCLIGANGGNQCRRRICQLFSADQIFVELGGHIQRGILLGMERLGTQRRTVMK